MICIFEKASGSDDIMAVPLRHNKKHNHHEAKCPVCSHMNILADEADTCPHFVCVTEKKPTTKPEKQKQGRDMQKNNANVLVPRQSVQILLEELEKTANRLGITTRNHLRKLKSAIGTQPAVKSRTLHGIDLYDEQKVGNLYIARDQEGMLRLHDTQTFRGYITRSSTPRKPQAFRVSTFIGGHIKDRVATFQYLDQAENNLKRQALSAQKPGPKEIPETPISQKLHRKYQSKGFHHIDTGGNCTAMYLPLAHNKRMNTKTKDTVSNNEPQGQNCPYILVTDTGGLKAPTTAKDNLMAGIYDKEGEQISYHTQWKGKRLTSETFFRSLNEIIRHAKKQTESNIKKEQK